MSFELGISRLRRFGVIKLRFISLINVDVLLSIVGSGSVDALLEEVSEGDGVVCDEIHDGGVKGKEDVGGGGDESGLVAVASGEILRGDDTDLLATFRFYQQDFGVVVGEVGALHRLGDESPQFEGLVRSLVVEDEIEGGDVAGLLDEEQAAQELLGDGE